MKLLELTKVIRRFRKGHRSIREVQLMKLIEQIELIKFDRLINIFQPFFLVIDAAFRPLVLFIFRSKFVPGRSPIQVLTWFLKITHRLTFNSWESKLGPLDCESDAVSTRLRSHK